MEQVTLQTLTADIAAAFVSHNKIEAAEIGTLINTIGSSLANAAAPPQPERVFVPAVDPRRSVKSDKIISLIDGSAHAMIKRHLSRHGLTPAEYRARYNLPASYPMVAPDYSERRRQLAKAMGLGHHPDAGRGRRARAA